MKKALEAWIKYCDKEVEATLSNDTAFLCNRILKNTLCEMLAALDDEPEKTEPKKSVTDYLLNYAVNIPEPEKPESNESEQKIDFKYLEKNIFNLCCRYSLQHDMNDDEILGDFSFKLAKSIKDYFEHDKEPNKPAIDPEIKRVYDHWKKNDGIVVIERAFERDMWEAIKAHCERGE